MSCCSSCAQNPSSCCGNQASAAVDRLQLALWLTERDSDLDPVRGAMPPAPLAPGEIVRLAAGLVVPINTETASHDVELGGCNAVRVELAITSTAASLNITVWTEVSIDRQFWRKAFQTTLTSVGYRTWRLLGLTDRFLRIRYSVPQAGGDTKVLSASISGVRTRSRSSRAIA